MQETPNHNLQKFEQGDAPWSHNEDMQALEERVPIRDVESELATYVPHDGAIFQATDTEREFVGDGDGWTRLDSTGQDPTVDSLTATNSVTAGSVTATNSVTATDTEAETVQFNDAFRDPGRFEMIHLNTWNWGGNSKVTDETITISDYTTKDINKVLLYCEHMSIYDSAGTGEQTYSIQVNGITAGYENWRIDGTKTTDGHAILAKGASNTTPYMGNTWIHADQSISIQPGGVTEGAAATDVIQSSVVDNNQASTPWTIDTIRFFPVDGDQLRARRATLFGFSEGMNA